MNDVSFWVAHGAAVWQAALAASALAGLFVGYLLVNQAMRARARRVRDALGKASPAARPEDAGKRVTLSGTIGVAPARGSDDARPAAGSPVAVTVLPQGLELSEETTPKATSASARGAKLAVDVGGTTVVLDAPLQVLVGSRETERCVTRSVGQVLLWDFAAQLGALPSRPFGIRALAEGDRVRVAGVLRHEPEIGAPGDYRSAAATFALEVDAEDTEARVIPVAFEGSPRPLARKPGLTVIRALAVPLGAAAVLGAIGEIAIRVGRPWSSAVAATTPFRRGDALAQLRAATPLSPHADEALVRRAIAIDLLRGRCAEASDDAFEHGDVARSIDLAARCGDPSREARGHAALAEFDRAAAAFDRARAADPRLAPSLTEATAYIAAGQNERAAAALRALAPAWEGPAWTRERLECAAAAMDARTGSPEALEALRAKADKGSGVCQLLLADRLHGAERTAALSKLRYHYWHGERGVVEWPAVALALSVEEADPDTPIFSDGYDGLPSLGIFLNPAAPIFDPRQGPFDVPPGIADAAVRSLSRGSGLRVTSARTTFTLLLAMLDSFLGDVDAATLRVAPLRGEIEKAIHARVTDAQRTAWADHVAGLGSRYGAWGADGMWHHDEVAEATQAAKIHFDQAAYGLVESAEEDERRTATLERAIAARAAAHVPPDEASWELSDHAAFDAIAAARAHGDGPAIDQLAQRDGRDVNRKLWDLVQAHDGTGLVARLEARGLDGRGVVENIGRAAGMEDALRGWVRWSYPAPCTTCGLYPLANHVASRRDAAVAAGAADVAEAMHGVAVRLRALMLRRDVALPLAAISDLSPP